ncbi:MAG: alpha/beta fold hydrolase [Tepidiformaceae bacterium]
MAELTVNGARLEYIDEGRGDPPFVFVHGWACDLRVWQPQVADLSRDHRCVAVNLRGRGESEARPPFDSTQAADDVAALMQQLDLGPAIIVGHSLGGLVALLLNDRHPERVRGIVLGDSPLTAAAEGRFARTAELIREAGSVSLMGEVIESFFSEATPEEVKDHVREMMLTCPPDVAAGMLENGQILVDRLDGLIREADKKPFMAFWPESPRANPDRLRELTMFLRQEPIAGAGHFFQLEQPDLTNALLRAFLDDVERDPRIAR